MADAKAELEELRRLDELERRATPGYTDAAGNQTSYTPPKRPDIGAPPTGIGIDTWRSFSPEQREKMKQPGWGGGVPKFAYDVGGTVADKTGSPAAGYVANVATQALPALLSSYRVVGSPEASVAAPLAERLMRSAVKPSQPDRESGRAAAAIKTMLEEGINPTSGGMDKASGIVGALEKQVQGTLGPSTASIPKENIVASLKGMSDRARMQVNPEGDLAAISSVKDSFLNHPMLQQMGGAEKDLLARISEKGSSKAEALRDWGRFATRAAEQETLAHGGSVGGRTSPVANPVPGMPRVPGRVTTNIERVPEANEAADVAMHIAGQREAEKKFLEYQLRSLKQSVGDGIPVDVAHAMKQGTYRALGDKAYNEIGSVSIEAQKNLARSLRDEVGRAVPSVSEPLKREASIMNVKDVALNAVTRDANKDILGLAGLASNPYMGAATLADRWGALKAFGAQGLYTAGKPSVALPIGITADQAIQTDKQRLAEYLKKIAAEQGAQQ